MEIIYFSFRKRTVEALWSGTELLSPVRRFSAGVLCACVFRELRALVVEMVLATDMSCHFQQVKAMKNFLQQPEGWETFTNTHPTCLSPFALSVSPQSNMLLVRARLFFHSSRDFIKIDVSKDFLREIKRDKWYRVKYRAVKLMQIRSFGFRRIWCKMFEFLLGSFD